MTKVKGGKMLDIKEYLKQTKTVLLTQDAFDELMQRTSAQPDLSSYSDKLWRNAYERGKVEAEPQWIPVSERLPSEEECKEWIDKNLDGIGYLYPCLVTRYSSINPDRTKNNPYVAKHYFDGEDFLNAGEEVCNEYIIAWMPLPEPYREEGEQE